MKTKLKNCFAQCLKLLKSRIVAIALLCVCFVGCFIAGCSCTTRNDDSSSGSSNGSSWTSSSASSSSSSNGGGQLPPDTGEEDNMIEYADVVTRLYDTKWQAKSSLLKERSYQWSTADRNSIYNETTGLYEGWDGNDDGSFKIRDNENNSISIDIQGAGYVSRMWFGSVYLGGNIMIYVDGALVEDTDLMYYMIGEQSSKYSYDNEVIDIHNRDFYSKHTYDQLSYLSSRGFNTFIPITFSKSIKIAFRNDTASSNYDAAFFKQINYTLFDTEKEVESFNGFANMSQKNKDALAQANNVLKSTITHEGNTYTVASNSETEVYSNSNCGAINMITLKLPDYSTSELKEILRKTYIKMYWDNASVPAVYVSLGDFFGSPAEVVEYKTYNVGVTGDNVFYLRFYMPFEQAKIYIGNLTNNDINLSIGILDEQITLTQAEEDMRFCVSWLGCEDRPISSDRWPDVTTFSATGKGRLVGQIWHTYQIYQGFWWGEGDERIFVDGEKFPSWYGTGGEDVIGYSWSIPESWAFSAPFRAHPVGAGASGDTGDKINVLMMGPNSVTFESSIEMSYEMYFNKDYCMLSAISYYYLDKNDVANNYKGDYDEQVRTKFAPLDIFDMDVPSLYRYEGEMAMSMMKYTRGNIFEQSAETEASLGIEWSGRRHLCWFDVGDGTDNASLSFPFSVDKQGKYNLNVAFTTARDFVIVDIYVDDALIMSGVDLYSASTGRKIVNMGLKELSAGNHEIKFVVVGLNSNLDAFMGGKAFALDYFECLPENFVRIEGSDLLGMNLSTTGGEIRNETPDNASASNRSFLTFLNSANENGEVSFELQLENHGNYTLDISFFKAIDYPIVNVYLDGVLIGSPVDLYHTGAKATGNINFGSFDLSKGTHTITIKTPTKNTLSRGYVFAIDHIDITTNEIYNYVETSGSTRYEAENLAPYVTVTDGGDYWHQTLDSKFSNNAQLVWVNNHVGSQMEIPFNVHFAGAYNLSTRFCKAGDFATFDVYVNDVKVIEGLDGYNNGEALTDVLELGSFNFAEGQHVIKLVITGKNDASSGYVLGIDYIQLDYVTREVSTRHELEDYETTATATGGRIWKQQKDSTYSNGWQLLMTDNGQDSYFEFNINTTESGTYDLKAALSKAKDFAIIQFYVDGVKVGATLDTYSDKEEVTGRILIGKINLKAGTHTITIKAVGKNDASSGYVVGVDFIDLVSTLDDGTALNLGKVRYEFENLAPYVTVTDGGDYWHQTLDSKFSNNAQLVWVNNQVGSQMEIPFNVHHAGTYNLLTRFCKAGDFATFDVYVNGVKVIEGLDCYNDGEALTDVLDLGIFEFEKGTYVIKIVITGKNDASSGYVVGMDYLDLLYSTPNAFTRYELEDYETLAIANGGRVWKQQKDSTYSGGWQLLMTDNGQDSYFEFDIQVAEDGTYDLNAVLSKARDFAIIQFAIDGNDLGDTLDIYSEKDEVTGNITIGQTTLNAGTHTIKIKAVGKAEASTGYVIGVDFIDLVKVNS